MKKQVCMHGERMEQCKRKKSEFMSDIEAYKICLEKKRQNVLGSMEFNQDKEDMEKKRRVERDNISEIFNHNYRDIQ